MTINSGGDLATSGVSNRNNITLNTGGIISANNAAANYTDVQAAVAFSGVASGLTNTDTWTLKLVSLGFGDPTGQSFILFDGVVGAPDLNGGLVGTPTVDFTGTGFHGSPSVTFDMTNNDIILTGLVPEPGTSALLLGGLALPAGRRRRRRS